MAKLLMRGAPFHGQKGIFKLGSSNWPEEIVALDGIAFRCLGKAVLRLGFHALSNHGDIQSVRHRNNDASNGLASLVGHGVLNE